MAVVSVNKVSDPENDRSVDQDRPIELYIVIVDTAVDGANVALNASGIPAIGDKHPTNSAATARRIRPLITASRLAYMVRVQYSTSTTFVSPTLNPLDEDPEIEWGNLDIEVIIERDINDNPITNSAGDVVDPPLTDTRTLQVCRITRNEKKWDPEKQRFFIDTTNNATLRVAGLRLFAGQGRLRRYTGRNASRNGQDFFIVNYEIIVASLDIEAQDDSLLFHRREYIDQGFNIIVGGKLVEITKDDGSKLDVERKLDGTGELLPVASAAFYNTRITLEQTNWSGLDLPRSI